MIYLLTLAKAQDGFDISTLQNVSAFKCLLDQGFTFMSMRGFRSYGSLDPNAVSCMVNARAAGFKKVDAYMFPCRGKDVKSQVDQMVQGLQRDGKDIYDSIWIDVQTNPSTGCSWSSHSAQENCVYMKQLVNYIKSKSKKLGIYASYYMWSNIFGSPTNCANFNDIPLWYAHYDGIRSFSDFKSFAGWTKPEIKQYKGTSNDCGVSLDLNWKP